MISNRQISFMMPLSLSVTKRYCNIIIVTYKKGFNDLKQANNLYFVLKALYKKSIVTLQYLPIRKALWISNRHIFLFRP